MYIQHFGMAQYPFSLTPNTRYFLKLPSHEQAFDSLLQALEENAHFAKLVGEVGTGKTMLCRKMLNSLEQHRDRYVTAYIPHPILSEEGIMHAIAEELCIEPESGLRYYDLIKLITETILQFAEAGKSIVLFIDEAQAMPEETLKAVHLLSNIEAQNGAHLQVILFGQPEFDDLLKQPALSQLQEMISVAVSLPSLDHEGTESYIAHRLSKAGYNGPHMFSRKAVDLIHETSKGIPRLVNIICHKALMVAFGKGERVVTEGHIMLAVADTESLSTGEERKRGIFGF